MTATLEKELFSEEMRLLYGKAMARVLVAKATTDNDDEWEEAVLHCSYAIAEAGFTAAVLIMDLAASLKMKDSQRGAAEYIALKLTLERIGETTKLIDKSLGLEK